MLAKLLQRYSFRLPADFKLEYARAITMRPTQLPVIFEPRE